MGRGCTQDPVEINLCSCSGCLSPVFSGKPLFPIFLANCCPWSLLMDCTILPFPDQKQRSMTKIVKEIEIENETETKIGTVDGIKTITIGIRIVISIDPSVKGNSFQLPKNAHWNSESHFRFGGTISKQIQMNGPNKFCALCPCTVNSLSHII